ncbi:O-acetyl-ADP-ribose deacetylase (regulator of RNase III), contains Macro domain [Chitinophaga rupis]|uniref:O-acetyl-ADP-ribose deacetylase (Regulator of RNase III), contains Macro domain n=1 Tax=Chitinophaga rupis TaxID=573321 RepID=A0A1H8F8P0_9BACT|nr:macro domain-containing protein [Chitinophaga rupis]SEN27408.1 O-acetyl-ADP-ribose deacetylase (regulator of RNase III), contains Macro domain [Chitinophaga rupis]
MAVSFIKGDLFSYPVLYSYAHGCNCKSAMGKGIALQFRRRFPKMYEEYKELCNRKEFGLGDVFIYSVFPYTVFNLGTQESWRTRADLLAIKGSLSKMLEYAENNNIKQIGLPKIGAGLGGLMWDEVKSVIIKLCEASVIDIVVFEEYLPS